MVSCSASTGASTDFGSSRTAAISGIASSGTIGISIRAGGDQPPVQPCTFVIGQSTSARYEPTTKRIRRTRTPSRPTKPASASA